MNGFDIGRCAKCEGQLYGRSRHFGGGRRLLMVLIVVRNVALNGQRMTIKIVGKNRSQKPDNG